MDPLEGGPSTTPITSRDSHAVQLLQEAVRGAEHSKPPSAAIASKMRVAAAIKREGKSGGQAGAARAEGKCARSDPFTSLFKSLLFFCVEHWPKASA